MRNQANQFFKRGWCRFARDPILLEWVNASLASARATVRDPQQAKWLRYQKTWFAGVNVLPNDSKGAVADSGPLRGEVIDFIAGRLELENFNWDRGQVSVCYPGYPQPMAGESTGKARYRRERDAAHVDGLLPEGPQRRRHLREYHGFILGIPMVEFDANASPFVVWDGSHEIMRNAFMQRFAGIPAGQWGEQDVTEVYHAAREQVFATCERNELHARPGEAFLAHRLVLHGMAAWRDNAVAGADGRMICYFRPDSFGPYEWLNNP